MKILQKIKEWKLNRPESQWSKKKLAIAGAALVVAVGLVIGGKILVDHWQFKNYKVITRTELEDTTTTAEYAEFGDYILKQAFIINAIFLFYNVKNPVPWLFSFLHCFAISLHKYEQPLHLILIDITAVLMIFFIQLSKPLFLFLLFFYFSFGCFLYFFRIFYILFYVGMFFQSSYSILSI